MKEEKESFFGKLKTKLLQELVILIHWNYVHR